MILTLLGLVLAAASIDNEAAVARDFNLYADTYGSGYWALDLCVAMPAVGITAGLAVVAVAWIGTNPVARSLVFVSLWALALIVGLISGLSLGL